jgi:general secretion pathway protein C
VRVPPQIEDSSTIHAMASSAIEQQLSAIQATFMRRAGPYLPTAATVLLVLLIAHALAQLTWIMLTPTPTVAPLVGAAAGTLPPPPTPDHGRRIAAAHLFGEPPAVAPLQDPISAPETKLNLTLRGVFATGDPDGVAIISRGSGQAELFTVGDAIPGGATLKDVLADRVILERNQQLETLRMPEQSENLIDFEEPASGRGAVTPTAVTAAAIGEFRAEAVRNPRRLGEVVQIEPAQEGGQLVGYRLSPKGNPELFNALGLQAGDIVTQVNGLDLTDQRNGTRVLRDLMRAERVEAVIRRDGQDIYISQEIPQ